MEYIVKRIRNSFGKAGRGRVRYILAAICLFVVTAAVIFAATDNGEYGYQPQDEYLYISVTIPRGQSLADVLPESPEIAGYMFSHWSHAADGGAFDFRQPLYESATFYAIWRYANEYEADTDYVGEAPEYYEYEYYSYGYDYAGTYDYGYDYYGYDYTSYVPSYYYDEYSPEYEYAGAYGYGYAEDYEYDYEYHGYEGVGGYGYYNDYYYGYVEDYWYNYGYPDYEYAGDYWYDYDYPVYGYAEDYQHSYDNPDYGYAVDYWYSDDYPSYEYIEDHWYEYGYNEHGRGVYGLPVSLGSSFEETITVYFMWNHGGMWAGPNVFIELDYRANVAVYPAVEYIVTLDGEYVHVEFPTWLHYSDIGLNLPLGWTYTIRHEEVEIVDFETEEPEIEGFEMKEHETRYSGEGCCHHTHLHMHYYINDHVGYNTYTIVTIRHDIFDRPSYIGIMPLIIGAPYPVHILAPDPISGVIDNESWQTAIGTAADGNRVIAVPHNVELNANVNISGNRHIIITSYGTNLNNSPDNHTRTLPPYVVTHTATGGGRHFTLGANVTLTLSHIILDGGVPHPATTPNRGGVSVVAGSNLNMRQGSVIRNCRITSGGAVSAAGNVGQFIMTGNASIANNSASGNGGGVHISGSRTLSMSGNSSITGNRALNGAGVNIGSIGAQLIMEGSASISGNIATSSGGGVNLQSNGSLFTMNGGSITENHANGTVTIAGGGGIFVAAGASSHVTLNSGTISNNHAAGAGGGIFTTSAVNLDPLPAGAYSQLTIAAAVGFSGNTSARGGVTPPSNVVAVTGIANRPSSGAFNHPINNLDINFEFIDADWFRLNNLINSTTVQNIIIFPNGSTPPAPPAGTYHLVISDSGDGSTITTVHLQGGTTSHTIDISRTVTISPASGANIVIRMPLISAVNTPSIPPWTTTVATLDRHFTISANGHLTLGSGGGTGTITLDGNAMLSGSAQPGNRGGINLIGGSGTSATLILETGGIIYNNRATVGGGINVSSASVFSSATNPITIIIDGGYVIQNFVPTTGVGWNNGRGGGVGLDTGGNGRVHFHMYSGRIYGNDAGNGGGIGVCCGTRVWIWDGYIYGNTALSGGGLYVGMNTPYNHIYVHGGEFYRNIATTNGGGLHTGDMTITHTTITGGIFRENRATGTGAGGNGGGIFHHAGQLNLFGGTIIDNHANNNGGGIHSTDTTTQFGRITMDMNRAMIWNHSPNDTTVPGHPPLVPNPNPNAHLTISGNRARNDGGGVNLVSAAAEGVLAYFVVCDNVTITNNSAGRYGGGIAINHANRRVLMTGGEITNNGGPATLITNAAGATIDINTHNGGGVHVLNGTFTMLRGDITGNHALGAGGLQGYGGGVHLGNPNSSFIMDDAHDYSYTYNVPNVALPNTNNVSVSIPGGAININNNNARIGGGVHYFHGIWNYGANTGPISFSGNSATEYGGGIAMTNLPANPPDNHVLYINYLWTIRGNTAGINGGGISLSNATLTMTGGTIGGTLPAHANTAQQGGGVWVGNGSVFTMENGTTAVGAPTHGRIVGNRATSPATLHGGAGGVAVFTSGEFGDDHGRGSTFHMSGNAQIYYNVAHPSPQPLPPAPALASHGGGVRVIGEYSVFNFSGGVIGHDNPDYGNRASQGGGLELQSGGIFNMSGTARIVGNTAYYDHATHARGGGAVEIWNATMNMYDGTIENNFAYTGGGIFVEDGYFNMHGGFIQDHWYNPSGGLVRHGGGVRVGMTNRNSEFYMTGGTIRRNRAIEGGGVHVGFAESSIFTMTGGTIGGITGGPPPTGAPGQPTPSPSPDANVATRGGGVAVTESGTFIMEAGGTIASPTIPTIVGNQTTASHGGGGVLVTGEDSTFNMYDGIIERNAEPVWGGGVLVQNEAEFEMRGGEIRYHVIFPEGAAQGGASGVGVRLSGRFFMYGGEIHGNINNGSGAGVNLQGITGSAPGSVPLAMFHMHGGHIHNNEMFVGTGGGGLRVYNPNAQFIMNGGYIRNNTSHTNGGGVAISHNNATMTGGTIRSNTATGNTAQAMTGNGGGVFINAANLNFTMSGGTIGGAAPGGLAPGAPNPNRNLAANNGGGLWVGGGAGFVLSGANTKSIIGNSADYGGGVWVATNSNMTTTGATGVSVTYNRAAYMGGGIYTERLEYRSPISRYPGAIGVLPVNVAYSNLVLSGVAFTGNRANQLHVPPSNALVVLPATTFSGTSQTTPPPIVRTHPLNNYDINFYMPTEEFSFHKTTAGVLTITPTVIADIAPFLLPDAYFSLYAFTGTGTVPNHAYIPSANWVRLHHGIPSTGLLNSPITFDLTEDGIYHLVETVAPSGFMTPIGQWRIVVDANAPTGFIITPIGSPIPGFMHVDGYFFVPNMPGIDLPMTGGYGMWEVTLAGTTVVFIGMCLVLAIAESKRRRLVIKKRKA
ncbi:MAG: hypothetical protein FWC73_02020 [Defluviitaleaceae bacterium]|nr:hypothetical protein [Defluviitaleaceae bacterium]